MAESADYKAVVQIDFDTTQADAKAEQTFSRIEQRARNIPLGAEGGALAPAGTRRRETTPIPVTGGPVGPVGAAVQAEVNKEWLHGNDAGAHRIAAQWAELGVTVPSAGIFSGPLARGGFGPLAGQMYQTPIGPPVPPPAPAGVLGYQVGRQQYGPPVPPGFVPWGQPGIGPMGPGGFGPTFGPGYTPPPFSTGSMPAGMGGGGFGPMAGQQYGAPIGPPVPPGFVPRTRFRDLMNTNLFGTGQYMNLLFGSWEIAKAFGASAEAERFATLNPQDLKGQLKAQNAAIDQMGAGILGSVVGMMATPYRGRTAEIEAGATAIDLRTAAMASFAESSMDRRQAARAASAGGPIQMQLEQIKIDRENAAKGVRKEMDVLATASQDQYRSSVTEVERRYGEDVRGAVLPGGGPGAPASVNQLALDRAEKRRARELQTLAAENAANRDKRESALRKAIAEANIPLAKKERMLTALLAGGALAENATMLAARGQTYAAAVESINALEVSREITPAQATSRLQALLVSNVRQADLASKQLRGNVLASSLARTGFPLAAAKTAIDAKYVGLFGQLDSSPGNTKYAQQQADLQAAKDEELASAAADDARRATMLHEQWRTASASRAEQDQTINMNQASRQRQLDLIRDRRPISAQAEEIRNAARQEELDMMRSGRIGAAANARVAGMNQLDLLRRDYIESFSAVQVSKDFAFGLKQRKGEDPAAILKDISDNITNLQTPGQVSGDSPAKTLQDLLTEVRGIAEKFAATLTN